MVRIYIINTHTGYKNEDGNAVPPINIDEYPPVKEHLNQYYKQLSKRQDKGVTAYHLRSCIYMEDFSKQKIVWAEIARTGNAFTLDSEGYMVGNTGYTLVSNSHDDNLDIYYNLLAFLNSIPILFYLNMISTRLDETGWRWLRQYVDLLPIPLLHGDLQKKISVKVEKILNGSDSSQDINDAINECYNFNLEEIEFLNKFGNG